VLTVTHTSWHDLVPTSDDDHACTDPDCNVIVSDDALRLFMLPCPAAACTYPTNDGPCIFVPGDDGPECSYCGRSGVREDRALDHDPDDDEESPETP